MRCTARRAASLRRFLGWIVGMACLLIGGTALNASPPEPAWRAQWIGPTLDKAKKTEKTENLWTCYRKTFALAATPAHAVARIAVDSRYWLWVNGRLVIFEGGLKRGPNPADTYYDVVDLSPFLARGTNTIAVLAWYWGKDGFSHKSSGKPGLLFELNAGRQSVLSDVSWKTKVHPAYAKAQGPEPNFRLSEFPIRFDAQADIPNWTAAEYADDDWQSPVESGLPPAAPWNRLWPRSIPQWKNSGLREYANAADLPAKSNGQVIAARLPYNAQITPYLKINAPAGLTLTLRTDDRLNEIYAQYVTRAGVQEFEALAWMNGHTVLYDIPKGVQVLALKYRETGYDTDLSGAFTCDNTLYSRLWTKAQRTLYITMRDNYMDCPDRERAQWWGDAVNEIGETFYALSPSSNLLTRKAISDLIEWQRPDHALFAPCPAGNWNKELPPQMLASVGKYGFWTYYLYTGDAQTLTVAYPHIRDYLALWKTDDGGLIAHRSGDWDWSDWGDNIDARLLDNAWFCLALEGAANMAGRLGRRDEAADYRARRVALIAAVNKRLWDGQAYRTPAYRGATDDRGNGLAVVAGIADAGKFAALKRVLAQERHASPYMEKYALEALVLMGDPDAALARMAQRYGAIAAGPLTTLPEEWGSGGTDNHAWSGGPLTLLSQYIAGIAPLAPAYQTYQVRPQMGSLHRLHAVVDSVRGRIELDISRENNRCRLTLQSPGGTRAVVRLPVAPRRPSRIVVNGKVVWEQGQTRARIAGVTFNDVDADIARITVDGGKWEFEAE